MRVFFSDNTITIQLLQIECKTIVVIFAILRWFPSSSSHRYTQVLAEVWEPAQLVEVRLCLTVRQSLTSIEGAFPSRSLGTSKIVVAFR